MRVVVPVLVDCPGIEPVEEIELFAWEEVEVLIRVHHNRELRRRDAVNLSNPLQNTDSRRIQVLQDFLLQVNEFLLKDEQFIYEPSLGKVDVGEWLLVEQV